MINIILFGSTRKGFSYDIALKPITRYLVSLSFVVALFLVLTKWQCFFFKEIKCSYKIFCYTTKIFECNTPKKDVFDKPI